MKNNYLQKTIGAFLKRARVEGSALLLILAVLSSLTLFSQQTYSFTCGAATGSFGPTQAQINTAYTLTNLMGSVTVVGSGLQTWTVPVSGSYRIEAYGAEGGSSHGANPGSNGGMGAAIAGDFTLTSGQVFTIVVGQKGGSTGYGGGGGGGSYVVTGANVPLVVAGGGGGAYGAVGDARGCNPGFPGLTSTSGGTSNVPGGPTYGFAATGSGGGAPGFGGTNGYGGGSGVAAGGGGFLGDGANGGAGASTYDYGGKSFVNGSTGGQGTTINCNGGFGGGGGAQAATGYGAGGGGYSGGGGGSLVGSPLVSGNGGGGGSFNGGQNQLNAAGTNTGNGRVIITELCNISLTASTANSLNPSICAGQTVTLTTNAVSNFQWSNGNTTSPTIAVSPTSTTVYTLSAMSVSNCIAVRAITVIVSGGQPTLSVVSSTNQTCLGKTATLTASGAVTYTWTNGVSNGVSFFPSTTTAYTVVGQNGCGTVSAVSTISVNPLAVTAVSSATAVCTNKTATLSVTAAANSYTWQPGNITGSSPNLIVNPQSSTNYTISVSDGTCSGIGFVSVQADPVPTITSSSSGSIVCPGGTVSLSASGGINYTWTPVNLNGNSITVSPTVSTLYSVQGDNSFGCLNSSSQVIVAAPQPTLSITSSAADICKGSSATITIGGADTYLWSDGSTGTLITVSPTQNTFYTVVGTNTASTCNDTESVTIGVFDPVMSISGNNTICAGGTANLSATATAASNYTWTPGIQSQVLSVSPASNTIYTVSTVSSSNNISCPISAAVEVIVNANPVVTAQATRSMVCVKETATITAAGASTYSWTSSTNTLSGTTVTVSSTIPTTMVYTLTGVNSNSCDASIAVVVVVSPCNAINESSLNPDRLTVYPNPNEGDFEIQSSGELQLTLINQLGQVIRRIKLDARNNYHASLSELGAGVYFVVGNGHSTKVLVTR